MSNVPMWSEDKERLVDILSTEEFSQSSKAGAGWLEKALEYLIELISRVFEQVNLPTEAAGTVSTGIVVVTILVLLAIIYWTSRKLMIHTRKERSLFIQGEKIHTHTDYLLEARQLAQRGDWREAVRHLFLALLVYLQKKSWIRIEQWKTNWEYMEEIRYNHPAIQEVFRRHARIFEQIWYGQKEIDEQMFWEHVNELEQIWREEGHHG